jgi:hypothetical protein
MDKILAVHGELEQFGKKDLSVHFRRGVVAYETIASRHTCANDTGTKNHSSG